MDLQNQKLDYFQLLKRVKSKFRVTKETEDRFKLPPLEIIFEGKTTIFKNFDELAEVLRRDKTHMLSYFLKELGTSGNIEGRRVIFKGKVPKEHIETKVQSYIEIYVRCGECNKLDTKLTKEDKVLLLVCEVCGAHRPVHLLPKTLRVRRDLSSLESGQIYEFEIVDISKRGEGIAKKGEYTIFVQGTTKGQHVRAKIYKIDGKTCFAIPV